MIRPDDLTCPLSDGVLRALRTKPMGKLRPVVVPTGGGAAFTICDTFDQSLARAGGLLIETAGRLEYWGSDGAVLAQPAARSGDFVADLAEGPVKAALTPVSPLRSLMPIGAGILTRAGLALIDDEGKTHARAQLWILSTEAARPLAMARMQGLRGYDKALALLADSLHEEGIATRPEAGIYARLFPGHVPYAAKPAIDLGMTEPAFDAATDIIAAYLPVIRQNEAGILADIDTEFLHDYRIALRKIRSVLSLFKGVYAEEMTQGLKARFSALMAATGPTRDLDVYLLERQAYYDLVPDSLQGGLDRMFERFAEDRMVQQAGLRHHLQSRAYQAEITALTRHFQKRQTLPRGPDADRPAHDFACRLIWQRYRRICRIAEAITEATPDSEVHALRIHCKKLRYLMEFFAPVFPRDAFKSLIKPLKRLQDNLGAFNDYSVQQDSLQAFLQSLDPDVEEGRILEIAPSVGALIAVLHGRQLAERERVVATFEGFNSRQTQATFRALFHARKEAT
jgi:CHAD domain-containing protein